MASLFYTYPPVVWALLLATDGAGPLFNLVVAPLSAAAFLAMGWNDSGRTADVLGNVALFCVAALSLPALFVAPIAARWSSRVHVMLLRRVFAVCLALIAAPFVD